MSNEIFGVDIAAAINDAFAGNLHPLTLRKITQGVPDSYGVPATSTADYAGEGVRLQWDSRTATDRGYAQGTVRILVLQNGIVAPTKDDEITILASRYRIKDIEADPVNATWEMAGVPA